MQNQTKVICITGASSGIGEACSRLFAKQKCALILGARRKDRLQEIKGALEKLGAAEVVVHTLDVTSSSSVDEFCNRVLKSHKLDVLINNAGLALGTDPIAAGDEKDWQTVFDTNVMGVLRITRKILPQMIENNSGQIVFLSSVAAHQVYEGGGVYCASKFAVKALAKTLKLELNGKNIRINTIDPGMVETEFSQVRFKGDMTKAKKVYTGLKPLTADDIAQCVGFVVNAPPHLNVDEMIVMPTDQATVYKIHRS